MDQLTIIFLGILGIIAMLWVHAKWTEKHSR